MDPLIPPSIQKLADAAGLTWNEYVNTLSPQDRKNADRDIVFYTKMRNKQIDDQRRSGFNERTLAGPLGTYEIDPSQNASATPTPSEQQDPLLTHPTFVSIAQSQNKTPQEYLDSLSPIMLENSRKILLGVEPELQPQPAAQAPVLQTAVDPASRAGEEPGVLTPRVPGEGVIAAPVANPADAPTSYADMSPQDFQRMAQNPADVPAGAEFPGLGADFSGIERFDSAMEQRTQAAREGIDQGVLQQQAASGDARALAELERRKNVPQGPVLAQLEAENSQSPALQAPVDFATLEAQNSKSPVLINTTTPAPNTTTPATNTTTANTAAQTPALSTTSSTTATRAPALSRGAGNMTANARGSNFAFDRTPRGESLIRIGGAMYSGALQGDGLGAATREYGSIQDADRDRAVKEAEFLEAQRVANARQAGINARASTKGGKGMPSAQALMYGQAALSAIERTEALVAAEKDWAPWDNTTGIFGNLLKNFPATAANDVMANIKTIEAAVGFDRLQAMRDASPTGGALGQVSNIELDLLKSSLANLNQSQSKGAFLTNLAQVKQVYNDIVNGTAGGGGGGSSFNASDYTIEEISE